MIVRLLVNVDIENETLLRLATVIGNGTPAVLPPEEIAGSFARQIQAIVGQFQGVQEVKTLYLPPLLQAEQML